MNPTPLKGAEWSLQVEDGEALRPIPGLRVHAKLVSGMIDAVAAACAVQGANPPDASKVLHSGSLPLCEMSLRDYQSRGVARLYQTLRTNGGALLADDVGLGKSRQAVALTKLLKGRTLIVCPAYVRETWRAELAAMHEASCAVLGPATNKKKQAQWENANNALYVITSYELVDKALAHAFKGDVPDTLILDEAHYLCGRHTRRGKAIEDVARLCAYRLALTATPMYSRPRDFYRLLRILFGARFGTPSDFDFRYCAGQINAWGGMENRGVSNADELKLRLSYYMVRRTKSEVLSELPPLSRQIVWCDPTPAAHSAFQRAMQDERSERAIADALIATLDAKVPVAVELAEQAKQFLLFTYLKRHAVEMHRQLNEELGTPCVLITGDMPADKRAAAAAEAARARHGVVATIDSAGAGLNALRDVTSYGIMHAVDWVPNKLVQAEGRLHRMGQTLPVQWVYTAMRESMDEVVVRTVVDKLDQWRSIIGQHDARDMRDSFDDGVASDAGAADALRSIYEAMT